MSGLSKMSAVEFKQRIISMLIGWCAVGIIYGSTRFIPGKHWVIPELWLDQQISFSTQGIWLYLSFFVVVPFAFLRAPLAKIKPMMIAILISALISGLVFVIFPTTLVYPEFIQQTFTDQLLYWLLWIDTAQNCLPSLHAALTVICLLALWNNQKLFLSLVYLSISVAIGFSIIQLRRHLSLDVGAGILVGILSYIFASRLHRNSMLTRKN
jgi:membrane-associated phospholipid phosphatase